MAKAGQKSAAAKNRQSAIEVLVFGNRLVKADSIALRVAEKLRGKMLGFEFRHAGSLLDAQAASSDRTKTKGKKRNLILLDAVQGIKKVKLINDLGMLESAGAVSAHDLDLGFELRLLGKLGIAKHPVIIGIPRKYALQKAAKEVELCLKSLRQKA